MSTIVEARIPGEQFALQETLSEVDGATFEIVRLVANGSDCLLPFLWGTADELDVLADAIEADSSTEDVEVLTELADEYLFRMEWRAHVRFITYIMIEERGAILDAYGKNGCWEFRILFPERESVSTTYEFCDEYGIDLEFERVYQLSKSFRRGQYGLTDGQYDTIVTAYQSGYYDVPRGANLTDLASDHDVTHQALSEQLRRGHETLVRNALHPQVG